MGYARVFSTKVEIPGRGEQTISFIVGSGFYPSADQDPTAHRNDAFESVMPQIMRAMTASTLDAVSARVENAVSRTESSFSLGGASTLSDILLANGTALENGTLDLARLLDGSSFAVPLNETGTGEAAGSFAFWGSGDYRKISGGNLSVDYDGSVSSASIGVDSRFGPESLVGVAITRSLGQTDYKTSASATNELTATVASVSPYMGWHATDGRSLWAALSLGSGEVEIEGGPSGTQASDLTQRMAAMGIEWPLFSGGGMLEGGTTSLHLNGEAAYTWAVLEDSGTPEDMELSAHRQRLTLKGVHEQNLNSGATISPSLEVGMRNDTGDGDTGAAIEAAGGLRYSDMAGLTIEGKGRVLVSHKSDYEEWGMSGLVRFGPGSGGQGLALVVQPAWGRTTSSVQQLWENGIHARASADYRARLNAQVGYGLSPAQVLGVVTPYVGVGLAGADARTLRLGTRWQVAAAASISLEGMHHETAQIRTAQGLMLRCALRW